MIDFKEFSSPTNFKKKIIIKKSSIRVILGLAVNTNLENQVYKIVDESILFFFRVSLSKFSLETLYISWV